MVIRQPEWSSWALVRLQYHLYFIFPYWLVAEIDPGILTENYAVDFMLGLLQELLPGFFQGLFHRIISENFAIKCCKDLSKNFYPKPLRYSWWDFVKNSCCGVISPGIYVGVPPGVPSWIFPEISATFLSDIPHFFRHSSYYTSVRFSWDSFRISCCDSCRNSCFCDYRTFPGFSTGTHLGMYPEISVGGSIINLRELLGGLIQEFS